MSAVAMRNRLRFHKKNDHCVRHTGLPGRHPDGLTNEYLLLWCSSL